MNAIPAPLVEADDGRVPVTVWLTPAQAARLELVVAAFREHDHWTDNNDIVDSIFHAGLDAAEARINHPESEQPA
ncbi:hypothetical protein PA01_12675 [Azoarcus sp. PA01]|nr:hypothetical protein PA01_12675 [Azoarcus sp. PA01]